ncbi:MAG: hypothetical protein ACFFFK_07490 [Candidatus Thorarchaeota archaeon]
MVRMESIKISCIDTAYLDTYINESVIRWREAAEYDIVRIATRRVWKDELNTKAVYFCPFCSETAICGPYLMIYVDYNEVEMSGIVEFEIADRKSIPPKLNPLEIFDNVFSTYDPTTAPLPFGVKCQHCGATYVYKKRTGIVVCQNCGRSFDLGYEKVSEEN